MSHRPYNLIYSRLVVDDNDIVGLIAYGIYKKHKIEFITQIKTDYNREPNEDEYNAFALASSADSQLKKYRQQAENILSDMFGYVVSDELDKAKAEMLEDYESKIKNAVRAAQPSAWKTIGLSIIATIIFSFGVAIAVFLSETSETSISNRVHNAMESYSLPATTSANDSVPTK